VVYLTRWRLIEESGWEVRGWVVQEAAAVVVEVDGGDGDGVAAGGAQRDAAVDAREKHNRIWA